MISMSRKTARELALHIIFEMDFLGEGAADLCAGEFLVPLASGRLLPPASDLSG